MTALLVAFLAGHGFVHLAIWLPRTAQEPEVAPLVPDHSAVLTAVHVSQPVRHALAALLAVVTGIAFGLAAIGVAMHGTWAVQAALLGAVAGLVLKLVFFDPWLTVGIALDVLVLAVVLTEWPFPLVG
jgi:hypothetical protein